MIDRAFKGLGRLHRASGMTHAAQFRAFNDALTEMARDPVGRDWIRALIERAAEPLDVYAAWRTGAWRSGPEKKELTRNLVEAVKAWRERTKNEVADETYRVRLNLVHKLEDHARATATVADAVTIVREWRTTLAATPPTFNLLRNYVSAFLRDTVGKRHRLYQDLKFDVPAIKIPHYHMTKERKRHPLTPLQVLMLAGCAGDAAGPLVGMALTGMNPKEYWGEWEVGLTGVRIYGTKRGGRNRFIPKAFPSALWSSSQLVRPTMTRQQFEVAFRAAKALAKLVCQPMDLRRSFANWMIEAGIAHNFRRIYRGHGPKDMGDVYETPEFKRDLAEHGAALVTWLNAQLAAAQSGVAIALVKDGAR